MPRPPGGTFAAFGPPTLNRQGAVAFGAAVEGRAVPGGIFVWSAGQIRMVLGAGSDTPIGGIFAKFSERHRLQRSGHDRLSRPAQGRAGRRRDLRHARTAAHAVVAQLGDPAPGGGRFSNFGLWPAVSATGTIGFAASVDDGPSPVIVVRTGRAGVAPRGRRR